MPIEAVAKIAEIITKTSEKIGEVKEVALNETGAGKEVIQPDMEVIKSYSLESVMQSNCEKAQGISETVKSEYRSLTEEEYKYVQSETNMSDATMQDCRMNENNELSLKCTNEDLAGSTHEVSGVPYVEKTVKVGNIEIKVVVPEFPSNFEIIVPKELYLANDAELFKYCTQQLKEDIEKNPELAKKFNPQQLEQIMKEAPYIKGYSWHHSEIPGKMQLVETKLHAASGHTGGKAIWGGGRN